MQRFKSKVVLVTGAASGIGRATALRFGAEGATIFASDVNTAGLKTLESELVNSGVRVATHEFDVGDAEACAAAVDLCVSSFGQLDILCNIAGMLQAGRVETFSPSDWQRMLDVNLSSVFFLSQAAAPHLVTTKGNIINMSSAAGLIGQAYTAMYCATKTGVIGLTRAFAVEFAKRGVRANAICPGGVNTPLGASASFPEDADMELVQRLFPLVDVAEPKEIAAAAAYLASEEARYVNGVAFPIDGTQTIC